MNKITWKQIGIFWLILVPIVLIFGGIYSIHVPSREYSVGMCLVEKNREFPTCYDINEVIVVGNKKVMLRRFERQDDKCGFEWEKYLLDTFYKEVPCSCEGLRTCN